ncbi:MAG: glycosyltransferase family protein, partial [Acidimicrobiales bacterium]
ELLPVLAAARHLDSPPVVVCSVRDILVANGPGQQRRDDQAARRLNRYFDAVIVHADPRLVRLEDTFRPSIPIDPPVHYSGFVVRTGERPTGVRRQPPEILVSAGGGMVGGPLLRTAAEAQRLHLGALGITTRIVTGPFLPPRDVVALHAAATGCPGLTVERFVPDLGAAMVRASVSVSQCGYNTALDVLRSGVAALVVPYDGGRETEQAGRAQRLAHLGALRVLPTRDLSAARLAHEVVGLLSATPKAVELDL